MAIPADEIPKNKSPNAGDEQMSELRKYLMLMAVLAATVTYVAVLKPPGGVWLETEDGHLTGNQILVVTHRFRYNAFYYSNVIAFMASVVAILLLLLLERSVEKVWWLLSLRMVLVLDLLALMVAYAAGASRGTFATVYVSVLVTAVSMYAGTHIIRYFQAGGPRRSRGADNGSKKEHAAKEADDTMKRLSKILMVAALFAATATYTAGLNPPGGFWPNSQDGHRAGYPVLQDYHHWLRFMAFFACNSAAFAASLVAVMLLTTMNHSDPKRLPGAYWFVQVALLGFLFAYSFGSSRTTRSTIHVLCVQLPLLLCCIVLQFFHKFCWKLVCKLGRKIEGFYLNCSSRGATSAVENTSQQQQGQEIKEYPVKERLKEAHELVLLLATLAATITYQAGMNPPGGVWPDDRDGHQGGNPILLTTHARRYKMFFYCNSVALVASIIVIAMLLSKHLRTSAIHRYHALEATMILDLLSLVAAYVVGCCRDVGTSLCVIALAADILVYILIHMVLSTPKHPEEEDKTMKKKRKLLLLLAILAATITYQAGLTPPGGFWQDGQAAGYAVLATNYPRRYTTFFYCNATSFISSTAVILLLVNRNLYKFAIKCYVLYVCSVAGLFGLAGAYVVGSARHMRTFFVVIVVLVIVSIFVLSLFGIFWILYRKPTNEAGALGNAPKKETKTENEPKTASKETTREEGDGNAPKKEANKEEQSNTGSKKEGGQSSTEKSTSMYMYTTRKYMTMVAILVASVTYQAGLTPPGGVWPNSTDGHAAGDPVLHDTSKLRYHLFFYGNSGSFLMSLLVIFLLLLDESLFGRKEAAEELPIQGGGKEKKKKKKKKEDGLFGMGSKELLWVAQCSLLLALLSLLFAYAAGCSREWGTFGYVFALAGGMLFYLVVHVLLSYCDKRSASADDETTTPPAHAGKCTDDKCSCKCHAKYAPDASA